MKKLMNICVLGAAIALSACASKGGDVDYSYERAAPYGDERTVGMVEEEVVVVTAPVETKKAERVFESAQRK
ncbi:MAG: hypothetical protein KDJ15_05660 [Alphaproteobacteria bacterium]|nr:hypothetical protein [Alphaproteobacteria bacterium]